MARVELRRLPKPLDVGGAGLPVFALGSQQVFLDQDVAAFVGGWIRFAWRQRTPRLHEPLYSVLMPVPGMGGYKRRLLTVEGVLLACNASGKREAMLLRAVLKGVPLPTVEIRPQQEAQCLQPPLVCEGLELRRFHAEGVVWVLAQDVDRLPAVSTWWLRQRMPLPIVGRGHEKKPSDQSQTAFLIAAYACWLRLRA